MLNTSQEGPCWDYGMEVTLTLICYLIWIAPFAIPFGGKKVFLSATEEVTISGGKIQSRIEIWRGHRPLSPCWVLIWIEPLMTVTITFSLALQIK